MAAVARYLTLADGSPPILIGSTDSVTGVFTPTTKPTADANGAAFQGVATLTPGAGAVAAGRSLGYVCTTSGTVTLTLADASTITLGIIASAGFQTLPFAVVSVVLGTAAGQFWNLK